MRIARFTVTTALASLAGVLGCAADSHPTTPNPINAPAASRQFALGTQDLLSYYGGNVISNVNIVQVNWNSGVDSAIKNGMGGFYSALTSSEEFDWLDSDYRTDINANAGSHSGQTGTNQRIGHGTFGGQYTLSQVSNSITDADIKSILAFFIDDKTLPAPDANTLYMVHFPPGSTITNNVGQTSCVDFCAYHGTMTHNNINVKYGVVPDFSRDCASGCGADSSYFNNATSAASHEVIEAVTDPDVGLASTTDFPLGWYYASGTSAGGEIGDICNQNQSVLAATKPDGTHYVTQREYDNNTGNCIVMPDHFEANGIWLANWSKPDFAGAGDFNGDGKADLAWYEAWNNNTITIATSDGNGHFFSAGGWLSGWGKPDWAGIGDFNGDGKADIAWYTAWDQRITMALSTGTGFQTAVWLSGWGKPDWAGVGDFNGDGKSDIVWYEASTQRFTLALSTGGGFQTAIWLTGWGKPDWAGVGDFNGDGKSDIAWYEAWNNGGSVTLALSTGSAFSGGGRVISGWSKPDWAGVGDFDGDGISDLAWYENWNAETITVVPFTSSGRPHKGRPWLKGWGIPDLAFVGDFNHDHRADIGWFESWNNNSTTVARSHAGW